MHESDAPDWTVLSSSAPRRPGLARGVLAALTTNVFGAVVAWIVVVSRHGYSGVGAISYHFEEWLWPVFLLSSATAVAGLALLLLGEGICRWFAKGLIIGALLAGFLECAWTASYFISQGS